MNAVPETVLDWTIQADGLCELVLERAPLNEIGEESLAALEGFVRVLPDVRGLLVRSALERGFSAGADLRGLHQAIEARGHAVVVEEVRAFLHRIGAAFTALDEAPVPTVAAVHGVCFGGGLELALTCDLIVADRTARFGFPELRLGLVPGFGGVARLKRDVGNARVRDLLFTGRSLNAERAREAGLVSQVLAPGKHVAAARRTLEQTMKHDGVALAAAKRLVKPTAREALDEEIETFVRLFARPEVARALAEFAQRDDPLPYLPASRHCL